MSMFENSNYRWRETYFIQFDSENRPSLKEVQQVLSSASERFVLTNLSADKKGRFESLTLLSPDDFSALDISYLNGPEVLEQGNEFADELKAAGCAGEDKARADKLRRYQGRFDILHFEQISDEEDLDEMLDPSALLLVLETLAQLTEGITVDPQSGTIQ